MLMKTRIWSKLHKVAAREFPFPPERDSQHRALPPLRRPPLPNAGDPTFALAGRVGSDLQASRSAAKPSRQHQARGSIHHASQ